VHSSRLSTLLIDVPGAEAAASAAFWSAALGVPATPVAGEPQFTSLPGAVAGLVTAVQAVGAQEGEEAARFHVDIETDDTGAEVARLTALGAVPLRQWLDCHVLRAPGGHLLCVIPLHSDPEEFAAAARTWP
jgi:hypothetical protein